jgi:hypothetical protein
MGMRRPRRVETHCVTQYTAAPQLQRKRRRDQDVLSNSRGRFRRIGQGGDKKTKNPEQPPFSAGLQ